MKTIREQILGKATLRLVETGKSFAGIVLMDGKVKSRIDRDDQEDIWQRLQADAASSSPNYFGFNGARNRFLTFFPNGFLSTEYQNSERNYKIEAKTLLDETVPLEAALNGSGYGEAIRKVLNKTNLISPFEKMRLNDVLRSDQADQFINGAAQMALGDIKAGLRIIEQALKPHEAAKWTAVTYLPFLWQPADHMFLKPTITKDFAERVGHNYYNDYETKLNVEVYESLIDLADKTEKEISDLEPQDRIDVQSFIWIVGAYDLETDMPNFKTSGNKDISDTNEAP